MTFDLDATLGLPFTFTFGGETYTLPPDVDFATLELLDNGKLDDGFRRLLGAEQWERLEASPSTFGMRAFTNVFNAYMAHLGIDAGKSAASPDSSASTVRQSKPTSSGTTPPRSPGSVTVLTG